MAKIHQNAQPGRRLPDPQSGWSERQKAAGYAYGAGGGKAAKPETLGRFPIGPGGVAPNPNAPLPDYPGMWGAGRKKSGGGGGGGKKKIPTPTPRPAKSLIPPITKENTQGAMTPPITPENTEGRFPPDLAVSPNPYQPGSPVNPNANPMGGQFQGPPMPTGIDALPPDLAVSPNPYQTGSPVNPNANPNPFGSADPKDILAAIIAAGGGGNTGSISGGGPVVQPGVASGSSPILGGQRPVIDIMKLFRGG